MTIFTTSIAIMSLYMSIYLNTYRIHSFKLNYVYNCPLISTFYIFIVYMAIVSYSNSIPYIHLLTPFIFL